MRGARPGILLNLPSRNDVTIQSITQVSGGAEVKSFFLVGLESAVQLLLLPFKFPFYEAGQIAVPHYSRSFLFFSLLVGTQET